MPISKPQDKSDRLFHRLSFKARQDQMVFDGIPWKHHYWKFLNTTAGGRPTHSIFWNKELYDGSRLTDHGPLLEDFKLVTWSSFTENERQNKKAGTLNTLSLGIYCLTNFMVEYGLARLGELTPVIIEYYVDWLTDDINDGDLDIEITTAQVEHRIAIINIITVQSRLLSSLGYDFPKEELLSSTARAKIKSLTSNPAGTIPAIPDELAIALINEAYTVIKTQSDDTFNLLHDFLAKKFMAMKKYKHAGHATSFVARSFEPYTFQISDTTGKPWRPQLERTPKAGRGTSISDKIRELTETLRDACLLIIQACTGIRTSELCGLEAESNWEGPYPSCIKTVPAESGLYELFYLCGKVFKLREQPEECEWLIGVRPVDSDALPFIVETITTLERLHRPLRELGQLNKLVVIMNHRSGLPTAANSVSPLVGKVVRGGLKKFARDHTQWSTIPVVSAQGISIKGYIDTQGKILRPHQWRKNFGQFLYRVDHSMIPAISRHFKHTTLIMTEQNYIGNDYRLLDDINSTQRREHSRFLYEYCTGQRMTDGLGGKLIDVLKPQFQINPSDPESSMARIDNFCTEQSLISILGPHGRCLMSFSPLKSECHKAAKTVSWANKFPNYQSQTPGMCTGCSCFVVDATHLPFWKDRHQKNNDAWLIAKSTGEESQFSIAFQRAAQAEKIIRKIEGKNYG
ncbi:hypothetical protein [Pseudomonas costantinii]|uniref:hypothetical protein n=1 Tax=Pseudomonas costantinii TaxID=168469 RepID=UPI00159FAF51|nr:hypothetical protein [Pseudomonas costantinii]NVZ69081.1 hypothetical protein [Pseudomonas costantinii]